MRRMLVTGGAGFIGANFVHHWLATHPGDRVVVLDALTYAGNLASLEAVLRRAEVRFVRGDICERAAVVELLQQERIDTILHFAAESHVDRSIAGPGAFVRTNVLGTYELLEAARTVWLSEGGLRGHRFHHVSTDEVYGSLGPDDPPFTETTRYAPNSPYSASKAASDHLVRSYQHTYGLDVTMSNCSNNYGPYHFPEKLVPLMIVNILAGRALPVYGDGRNVRDWLHVHDHCRGLELVVTRGRRGEIYNIGGRAECANIDLVSMLCSLGDDLFAAQPGLSKRFPDCPAARGAKCDTLVSFVADRPGHDRRYAIDCTKIERELGFSPSVALRDGMKSTFEWFVQNEAWWRGVMDGSYRQWLEQNYATRRAGGKQG